MVVETEHTVTDGWKTFHKKAVSDLVDKNPELLQGKINYLTKKRDVERSNSTRKFTNAGGKNSHMDTIYAKGAVTREPHSTDDEDETQPKPKKAKKIALVSKAGNTVNFGSTAP